MEATPSFLEWLLEMLAKLLMALLALADQPELLAGIPVVGLTLVALIGKLGRAWAILGHLVGSLRDRRLSDQELATAAWMLMAVLLGLWWNVSRWVLDLAPEHQVALLKAKKFIPDSYRPEVAPAGTVGSPVPYPAGD